MGSCSLLCYIKGKNAEANCRPLLATLCVCVIVRPRYCYNLPCLLSLSWLVSIICLGYSLTATNLRRTVQQVVLQNDTVNTSNVQLLHSSFLRFFVTALPRFLFPGRVRRRRSPDFDYLSLHITPPLIPQHILLTKYVRKMTKMRIRVFERWSTIVGIDSTT